MFSCQGNPTPNLDENNLIKLLSKASENSESWGTFIKLMTSVILNVYPRGFKLK